MKSAHKNSSLFQHDHSDPHHTSIFHYSEIAQTIPPPLPLRALNIDSLTQNSIRSTQPPTHLQKPPLPSPPLPSHLPHTQPNLRIMKETLIKSSPPTCFVCCKNASKSHLESLQGHSSHLQPPTNSLQT